MFFPADTTLDLLARGIVLGPLTLLWVVVVVQIVGLRTFSKMTSFDFVATVAVGSLLANAAVAIEWSTFIQTVIAIFAILLLQALLAKLRKASDPIEEALSNDPVLLMRDGEFLRDAMKATRVSESDMWGKLREANALNLGEVRAMVLETTGDISVLHGETLDDEMLTGVERE